MNTYFYKMMTDLFTFDLGLKILNYMKLDLVDDIPKIIQASKILQDKGVLAVKYKKMN